MDPMTLTIVTMIVIAAVAAGILIEPPHSRKPHDSPR